MDNDLDNGIKGFQLSQEENEKVLWNDRLKSLFKSLFSGRKVLGFYWFSYAVSNLFSGKAGSIWSPSNTCFTFISCNVTVCYVNGYFPIPWKERLFVYIETSGASKDGCGIGDHERSFEKERTRYSTSLILIYMNSPYQLSIIWLSQSQFDSWSNNLKH